MDIIHGYVNNQIVVPKTDAQVLRANLLQLKEIETYARSSGLPMEKAAQVWIADNSEYWRKKHNTL
jgi:hypothetical protein